MFSSFAQPKVKLDQYRIATQFLKFCQQVFLDCSIAISVAVCGASEGCQL
jgi:hypothetical protein